MTQQTEKASHTPLPWKVYERTYPHYLGGEHVERVIGTVHHHPQLKGPYPVVNIAFGIGETEGGTGVSFVNIKGDDAELIVTAVNERATLLQRLKDYEAALPAGHVAISVEMLEFLRGAGTLKGCWFGETPTGEKGAFWWRKYLPALKAE